MLKKGPFFMVLLVLVCIYNKTKAQCPVTITPTPTSVCVGATTTLTAAGATTYTWSSNAGGVSTASVAVTPLQNTIYTVTATTGTCVATQTVGIMVFSQPNLTATANPPTVCPGGTSNLIAGGATTYTWSANAGGGNNAATTVTLTPAAYTTYTVTASNGVCVDTQVVSVAISPVPNISVSATPQSVCAGGTSTLTASGASTYTWSTGPQGPTTVVSPGALTTYTVYGTNSAGCVDTQTVVVNVNPFVSLAINAAPSGVCAGGTTTLTASGASSYTWSSNAGGGSAATAVVNPSATTVYTVTGASGACIATQTVTVPIVTSLTISIFPTTATVCAGTTTTLTASGASSYTWSTGGVTTPTIALTPFASAIYTVTGASGSCTATQTVAVYASPIPSLTVTANPISICTGGATSTLTANGAATYTWSANAGSVTTQTVQVNPPVTTVYTVTGSNGTCTSTKTVSVNVIPTLSITATANPSGICVGGTSTLTASGAATFTWSANAGSVSTSTVQVNPTTPTVYTVTGTSGQCVTSQTVGVSIIPSITVAISPNPPSLCKGGTTTLTASGASTYTWSANAGGLQTQTVTVTPSSNTVYTVSASSGGCTATQTTAITVNPLPTVTIAPPAGTTSAVCTGTPYQFIGNANPGPIQFYSWHSSTFVPGIANINITNGNCNNCNGPTITFNTTGPDTLTLIATTNIGCIDSIKYAVSVSQTPTVTTGPVAPPPHICLGGPGATLYAYGATTFTWTPLTNVNVYANGDSALVNPTSTGIFTYSVTGTAGGCISQPVAITVTVDPVPVPALVVSPPNDSICSRSSGHFYVNNLPPTATYTWSQSSTNVGLGTFSGSNTSITPYYNGSVDTTFTAQVNFSVPGCPAFPTYTMQIVVVPTPTIHVVSDTVDNCNKMGDSLKVTSIPSAGVSYMWTPTTNMTPSSGKGNPVFVNPTGQSWYFCTPINTQLGCIGQKDSVLVLIGDTATVSITSQYHIICSGMSDSLTAYPQWTPLNSTYQYSWSPATGTVTANGDVFVVAPGVNTTYTLTVNGTCARNKSAELTLYVNSCGPITNADFSMSTDTICVNHCIYFSDQTHSSLGAVLPLFYQWVFPGGQPYGVAGQVAVTLPDTAYVQAIDSSAIPKIKVCYHVNSSTNTNGVFPVQMVVSHGPIGSGAPTYTVTHYVKVDGGPKADAGTNVTINLGDSTQLNGLNSTGGVFQIINYTWTPPDSIHCPPTPQLCSQPWVNPSQTTQYTLAVTDAGGCTQTTTVTVFVELKCYDPFVPTAFSPNNDGENDVLYVRSNCLDNFTFKVFDRWGEKVFETKSLTEGWDGHFRGVPVNLGVFVWTLEGFLSNGKEVKKHGSTTLVR